MIITGLGIGSVAVSETTGKTMTDHAVSVARGGQDCRVGRAMRNEDMCQTPGIKLQVVTTGVKPSTVEEIESKYR